MNAEFLEKDILISTINNRYVTPGRRKRLDSKAFIGATVVDIAGATVYPVEFAKDAVNGIIVKAGPFVLTYTSNSGEIAVVKGDEASVAEIKDWVRDYVGGIIVTESGDVVIDNTLTVSGAAADSKTVGDALLTQEEAANLLNIFTGGA